MTIRTRNLPAPARPHGFTLLELLVAVGVGSLVLAGAVTMFISGQANFASLGNYTELSNQSRLALDRMSRDIREASQVLSWQANGSGSTLVLTNALRSTQITYSWNRTNRLLSCSITGQPDKNYLSGCDSWTCSFYQRTPSTNWTMFITTNLVECKMVTMTWKCSRSVLGRKLNTENMVTAQIVLRNKP
jgi:prepilin-type N-terminal cleavage/methylation domain-containing protein